MGEQVTLQEEFNRKFYLNTSFFIRWYLLYGETMEDVLTM